MLTLSPRDPGRAAVMSEFGIELRRRRKAARLSLAGLSDLACVSVTYIQNIENDIPHSTTGKKYKPSVDVVDKLATALDWPLSDARPLAGYAPPAREFREPFLDDLPPELQNISALQGKVAQHLPPGRARDRYIAKLRASAEADLAMIEERLKNEEE